MINKTDHHTTFEIKNTEISVLNLRLKNNNVEKFEFELLKDFGPKGENKNFFDGENIIIDTTEIDNYEELDLILIIESLKKCKLNPIGIRSNNEILNNRGKILNLDLIQPDLHKLKTNDNKDKQLEQPIVHEVIREVVREIGSTTMIIDKTLRSGQKVYARGCDLVVLGMVNQGAEVVSDGNIHVYAPLRGKAMAGARGNTQSRIFTLCLEAELIAIAGVYRTSEHELPNDVRGKAAQIRLSEDGQEKMIIEALKT
jgi:septum site-determining protein MinC